MEREILFDYLHNDLHHDFTFVYSCCFEYRKLRDNQPVVQHLLMDEIRSYVFKNYSDIKTYLGNFVQSIGKSDEEIIKQIGTEEKTILSKYLVKKILDTLS
jgi:hypothetical protein